MKKYVVHVMLEESKTDGDIHRIPGSELMRLYGVSPSECVIDDENNQERLRGLDYSQMVHLYPRYHGDYWTKWHE